MILPLLECFKGLESRVRIIQADHEAGIDPIVVQVIEKAAAINAAVERPARGVLNEARLHPARRQLPQFLDSQTIGLRRLAGIQLVARDQLLGDAAAAALAVQGDLGVDFRSERKIRTALAVLLNTHVADANTRNSAARVEQRFG